MSELPFLCATRLAAEIHARRVGSVELLALYRDRIARFDTAVNAVNLDPHVPSSALAQPDMSFHGLSPFFSCQRGRAFYLIPCCANRGSRK